MRELIENFITQFCSEVLALQPEGYTELMMDDHDCIEWTYKNGIVKQFFVPEDNSFYTEDDNLIREMLVTTYSI